MFEINQIRHYPFELIFFFFFPFAYTGGGQWRPSNKKYKNFIDKRTPVCVFLFFFTKFESDNLFFECI